MLIAGVFTTATIALFAFLLRIKSTVERIEDKMGNAQVPESVLGRIFNVESEVKDVANWAIRHGFDRRHDEIHK